tara:strand:- start:177 stop:824 length:648 start_codon:yes stop_codon:yes gene_type:complete
MTTNDHKMTTNDHTFSCDLCHELFSTHAHKRRHELHYCKEIGNKKIINEKNKLIKTMQKQIDKLIEKSGNTTHTTITNNIQINSYGNEDLSHLTDAVKKSMLKLPYGMIPKMVEAIHFNDNKPENKNIILPNKRDNKIQIFRNNKWVYKTKDEVISDLIDGKYFIMDTYYDDNLNKFNPCDIANFIKFKKIFDKSDKELFEHIKNECELVMLNNR